MKQLKRAVDSDLICFDTAKFFIDGVIDCTTALLLDPYTDRAGKGGNYRGITPWREETLSAMFRRCLEEGFHIHCHTIGDGAVRLALDALESAYKSMSVTADTLVKYRVSFTHLQVVAEADRERMARLGVIAVLQPYWHFKDPLMWKPLEYDLIGSRAETEYPLNSFFREGVCVVSSSDYPVTPEPNPFEAIQIGVTRSAVGGDDLNAAKHTLLNPDEKASLMDMIASFTRNAAYERCAAGKEGMLKAGCSSDMIVVNRDPFIVDMHELNEIRVVETIFRSESVYKHSS
jgi:predicted amidohydrolase YtcJ